MLCAVGLAVAFKAQVWNIGAEGQLLMGGLVGSAVALQFGEAEGFWILPTVLISGMIGGGLWGYWRPG